MKNVRDLQHGTPSNISAINDISLRQVALLFLAFIVASGFPYWSKIRRLPHDTWLFHYPYRAYLGDHLLNGVFPFWDPFSSPGLSTGADIAGRGNYYPIAIFLGSLYPITIDSFLIEVALTMGIALSGTYLWLANKGASRTFSAIGAVAYVGSGTYQVAIANFAVQISMAYLPWLLIAIDMLIVGPKRNDQFGGCALAAVICVLMLTGGYAGLNYAIGLFVSIYALALLAFSAERPLLAIGLSITSILLTAAMTFIPLSEFFVSFGEDLARLRNFQGTDDAYLGHQQPLGLMTLFFANGSIFSDGESSMTQPGWGQLYIGSETIIIGVVGLVSGYAKRVNLSYLLLALLVFLVSLGPKSAVAAFFHDYVPGFASLRWHYFYTSVAILFLITGLTPIIERTTAALLVRCSHVRELIVCATIIGAIEVCAAALVSRQAFSSSVTLYEALTIPSSIAIWAVVLTSRWHSCPLLKNICLLITLAGTLRLLSAHIQWLDSTILPFGKWWSFGVDIVQFAAVSTCVILVFSGLKLRDNINVYFVLCLIVLLDMGVASNRYFEGGSYWRGVQAPLSAPTRDAATLSYDLNARDPSIANRQDNYAALVRRPVSSSYNPTFSPLISRLSSTPAGSAIFKQLLWVFPRDSEITIDKWTEIAQTPDILSLALTANQLRATIHVKSASLLLWTDKLQPGWTATVNDRPTVITPVLGGLKGVAVPEGQSTIVFLYRPPYLYQGVALLIIAFCVLGLLIFGYLNRHLQNSKPALRSLIDPI